MNPSSSTAVQPRRDLIDITVVLVLVQAVAATVVALGFGVVGVAVGSVGPLLTLGPLAAVKPVLLGVLAAGLGGGHRWAWRGVLLYEALALTGVFLNLLLSLLPQTPMDLTLTGILTTMILPIAVIWLLTRTAPPVIVATKPEVA